MIEETFDVTTAVNVTGFTAYYVNSGTANDQFQGTGGTQILSTNLIHNSATGRDDGYRFTISTGGILTLEYTENNGSTWITVNINGTTTEFSRTIDISKKYYIFFFDNSTNAASFRFELYGSVYGPPQGKSELFNYISFVSNNIQLSFDTTLNLNKSTTIYTDDTLTTPGSTQNNLRKGGLSDVTLDFSKLESDFEFKIYVRNIWGSRMFGGLVSDEWSMGGFILNNANSYFIINFNLTNDRVFFRFNGGTNTSSLLNTNVPSSTNNTDRGGEYQYKYKVTTAGQVTLEFSNNFGASFSTVTSGGLPLVKVLDTTKKYKFVCYDDTTSNSMMIAQINGSIPQSLGRLCDVSVNNNVFHLDKYRTSTTERYGLRSNIPFKPEDYDIMEFIFEVKTFTQFNLYLGFIQNTADLSTNLDINTAGSDYRFKCVSIGSDPDLYLQRNPKDLPKLVLVLI